jgi:hypothetical protein
MLAYRIRKAISVLAEASSIRAERPQSLKLRQYASPYKLLYNNDLFNEMHDVLVVAQQHLLVVIQHNMLVFAQHNKLVMVQIG